MPERGHRPLFLIFIPRRVPGQDNVRSSFLMGCGVGGPRVTKGYRQYGTTRHSTGQASLHGSTWKRDMASRRASHPHDDGFVMAQCGAMSSDSKRH